MKEKFLLGIATAFMLLTLLPSSPSILKTTVKAETIPEIKDPTPGYWETSEFCIGSVAVSIILPESNGTIDPSTEDWTDEEIEKVLSEIQYALDWWASQNPNASVSFIVDVKARVPTGYEPINRNSTVPWIGDVMNYLGFKNIHYTYEVRDYVNHLRDKYKTDWAFTIFVADSSNDPDGVFADYHSAGAELGGSFVVMTYDNGMIGIDNMDMVTAHEMGHIFWAADEYINVPIYAGYLNVSSIPKSGGIMDSMGNFHWRFSGAPHGQNGTWGQVGWRDSDGDGIQDIVDTPNIVYLNSHERIGNTVNVTGVATVTTYPNKNRHSHNPNAWHYDPEKGWIYTPINVTINKIKSVQYRINSGEWQNATITPWKFKKLVRYHDTFEYKESYAVVNFTFLTPQLEPGEHFIEIRAINQWGNEGYANLTVTIPEIKHDIAILKLQPSKNIVCQGYSMSILLTLENQGDITETFNLTVYADKTTIEKRKITLKNGTKTTITLTWNTTGFPIGNYTIKAYAWPIPGEPTENNELIDGIIKISIKGDVNADGIVDIFDCTTLALAFASTPTSKNWNPNADINNDATIDIYDLTIVAVHFAQKLQTS